MFRGQVTIPYQRDQDLTQPVKGFFNSPMALEPGKVLNGSDYLLASGERYMRFFAFEWAIKVERHFQSRDFRRFERWLKKYVEGWGTCDHLCCGPIGRLIVQYPDLVVHTHGWRRSRNRWLRRAAAVCLIMAVRKGLLFDEVTAAADAMLLDTDDLVQKGYGWALKEASKKFPQAVFTFVMERRDRMPRTAFRYAIEKLPAAKRKKAMERVTL